MKNKNLRNPILIVFGILLLVVVLFQNCGAPQKFSQMDSGTTVKPIEFCTSNEVLVNDICQPCPNNQDNISGKCGCKSPMVLDRATQMCVGVGPAPTPRSTPVATPVATPRSTPVATPASTPSPRPSATPTVTQSPTPSPAVACNPNTSYVDGGQCRLCFNPSTGQNGSSANPWKISNCHCLQVVGNRMDTGSYELSQNLECQNVVSLRPDEHTGFAPMVAFKGTLDGKGFVVKNLQIIANSTRASVSSAMIMNLSGTVKNIRFENVNIEAKKLSPKAANGQGGAAVLASYDDTDSNGLGGARRIENVTITGGVIRGQYEASCLAGRFSGNISNVSCTNVEIEALDRSEFEWAGGMAAGLVIGFNSPTPAAVKPTMSDVVFEGSVKGSSAAGLVLTANADISNVRVKPTIRASGNSGHTDAFGVVLNTGGKLTNVVVQPGSIAVSAPYSDRDRVVRAAGVAGESYDELVGVTSVINLSAVVAGGPNTTVVLSGIAAHCFDSILRKNISVTGSMTLQSTPPIRGSYGQTKWGWFNGSHHCLEENVVSTYTISP